MSEYGLEYVVMVGADGETSTQLKEVAEALRILGRDSARAFKGDREWAAQVLLAEMEPWAPAIIWKAHGRRLRELAAGEVESLIEDAVQSLALVASTSQRHFRGNDEASARAWCKSILLNHVSNELRARRARLRVHGAYSITTGSSDSDHHAETARAEEERHPGPAELANACNVLRSIRGRIFSSRRKRDAETTMRAVWCYLAYLAGASLEEQVRALGLVDVHASVPLSHHATRARRYRNRIYKLRERGRKALHGLWRADPSSE